MKSSKTPIVKRLLTLAILIASVATMATPAAVAATEQPSTESRHDDSSMVVITDQNFNNFAKGNDYLVVYFWTTRCAYCRQIEPIVEELAAEYRGRVVIGKCNAYMNTMTTNHFRVYGYPTLLLFKEGKLVDQQIGACPKSVLQAKIENLLK